LLASAQAQAQAQAQAHPSSAQHIPPPGISVTAPPAAAAPATPSSPYATFDFDAAGPSPDDAEAQHRSQLIRAVHDQWASEMWMRKRGDDPRENPQHVLDFFLVEIAEIVEGARDIPTARARLSDAHRRFSTSSWRLIRKIGSGGFGSVFLVRLNHHQSH
jgi:hypothetical protein